MQTQRRPGGIVAVLAGVLIAAGCATLRVNTYQWPGANFASYQTFTWGPPDRFSTGDPRLDNNEIFRNHVQRAVERELVMKRFSVAPPADADLIVHVHAHIDQRIESRTLDRELTQCEPGTCGPYVYEAGTLLLDFIDRRTNRVAWRGWAEGSLDAAIDNQARLEQVIDEAVNRIVARLPQGGTR